MKQTKPTNRRQSNKTKVNLDRRDPQSETWDPELEYLDHDRAAQLMLGPPEDAIAVGQVVPRVDGGFQIIIRRGVGLDCKSTEYKLEWWGEGLSGGLWCDAPSEAGAQGKVKGDRKTKS